jgi:hypothetical protein
VSDCRLEEFYVGTGVVWDEEEVGAFYRPRQRGKQMGDERLVMVSGAFKPSVSETKMGKGRQPDRRRFKLERMRDGSASVWGMRGESGGRCMRCDHHGRVAATCSALMNQS